MKSFSFIITAYKNYGQCQQYINRIRNEYKKLNEALIIIVTTAEKGSPELEQIKSLNDFSNRVLVIDFSDAPGNPGIDFDIRSDAGQSFKHKFIPARVLLSIQRGLRKAIALKCDYAVHFHTDTWIKPEFEQSILDDIDRVKEATIIVDLQEDTEHPRASGAYIPRHFHILPEHMLFNLKACVEIGYGTTFEKIWDKKSTFCSHNWLSPEALLGQYLCWRLTGKNCIKPSDKADKVYYEQMIVRQIRASHGDFGSLTCLPGSQ